MTEQPKSLLRKWRNELGYSLDYVCSLIEQHGLERPSEAKLSRIERDQDIPVDMLAAFEVITGIPAKELRPDIAKIFDGAAQ
jgi:hypothetical protein